MNKRERDRQFAKLWKKAKEAGMKAGENTQPTPMLLTEREQPFDRTSKVVQTWYVQEGPCGFAWITVRPGTTAFARWLKKHAHGHKGYYGGVEVFIDEHGQSIERKEAHAHALAAILREAGINATVGSRLD